MKKIIGILAVAAAMAGAYCYQVTAYKSGEYQDRSRNVKVCVYNYGSQNYYYSVASYGMCPMSLQVCR